MRLVHNELSKPQRALRAYLNTDTPPQGFKGNPIVCVDESVLKHDLTHFHLSRYQYIWSALSSAAWDLFDQEEYECGHGLACRHKPRGPLTREKIIAAAEADPDLFSRERVKDWVRDTIKNFSEIVPKMDDEILGRVNEIYERAVHNLLYRITCCALFHSDDSENETWVLWFAREFGREAAVFNLLVAMIEHELKEREPGQLSENEKLAYSIASGYLTIVALEFGTKRMRETAANERGVHGRALFDTRDTSAWRFLRKRLFNGLTQQTVLDAAKMGRRYYFTDQPYLDMLFRLHRKFGFMDDLHYAGAKQGGFSFVMEASPFAQKWVGQPTGNFEIAIYPQDEHLRRWLSYIGKPSFEHADGAIALASLWIQNGRLILEEMQSDTPDLIGMSNCFRIDDFDAAFSRQEPEFLKIAYRWHKISFAAVVEFARRNGFTEFYASTPWRILNRYCGTIHPDKARFYIDNMEELGGYLMHDYVGELGAPQYYWRFDVK